MRMAWEGHEGQVRPYCRPERNYAFYLTSRAPECQDEKKPARVQAPVSGTCSNSICGQGIAR